MSLLVPITLFGWIPVVLLFFAFLRPVRAVVVAYIGAWLFLPVAGYSIPGLPDYTKTLAATTGVLLGIVLFHRHRLLAFRPRWGDVPMAIWCLAPFLSSLSNGLGVYDGLAELFSQTVTWGVPYLIGRVYLTDSEGIRELALGILVGGLLYVPLCLWELRMAPTLHLYVYGFHQHSFLQHIRYGGYRPKVFMQHGLAVSLWMAAASLVAFWLWKVGREVRLARFPSWLVTMLLLITTVLCRSVNAIALLSVGAGAFYLTKWTRTRVALLALCAAPAAYMFLRATQTWSARELVELTSTYVNDERAESLDARLVQEDLFSAKAWQRPLFGWGGYGRMFPTDDFTGERLTRGIDSLWIIALGSNGLVGLTSWAASMLLPPFLLLRRYSTLDWLRPATAAPGALAVLLLLYTMDCLFNGMVNPIFVMAAGGLNSFSPRRLPDAVKQHTNRAKLRGSGSNTLPRIGSRRW